MNLHVLLATVVVGTLVVMLGSAELGYRVGRRPRNVDPEVASQVGTWEAALLGLLALLIGFTFAMAVTRFDGRRDLIRDEANAIYQVTRRAEYLPPPEPERLGGLLRRYVDARIRFYEAGLSIKLTEAAEDEAVALRGQLWSEVVKIARANFNSEMASLFVQSVDDLIDMGGKRRAALDNHVPTAVYLVLVLVAAVAVAATGYSCGLRKRRHKFGMVLLPVLIAGVVLLVMDLDHPRGGFITAGQGPMLRLRQAL
jgi:hypothetical protein